MDRKRPPATSLAVLLLAFSFGTAASARIALDEGRRVKAIAETRPSIDLSVYFRFGSSVLPPEGMPVLDNLGRALTSPELSDAVLVVAGHTDGLESDDFAVVLSLRRATAVKEYIVNHFNVKGDRLIVVGYGSADLKDLKNPFADVNRRVQVVNIDSNR